MIDYFFIVYIAICFAQNSGFVENLSERKGRVIILIENADMKCISQ